MFHGYHRGELINWVRKKLSTHFQLATVHICDWLTKQKSNKFMSMAWYILGTWELTSIFLNEWMNELSVPRTAHLLLNMCSDESEWGKLILVFHCLRNLQTLEISLQNVARISQNFEWYQFFILVCPGGNCVLH